MKASLFFATVAVIVTGCGGSDSFNLPAGFDPSTGMGGDSSGLGQNPGQPGVVGPATRADVAPGTSLTVTNGAGACNVHTGYPSCTVSLNEGGSVYFSNAAPYYQTANIWVSTSSWNGAGSGGTTNLTATVVGDSPGNSQWLYEISGAQAKDASGNVVATVSTQQTLTKHYVSGGGSGRGGGYITPGWKWSVVSGTTTVTFN